MTEKKDEESTVAKIVKAILLLIVMSFGALVTAALVWAVTKSFAAGLIIGIGAGLLALAVGSGDEPKWQKLLGTIVSGAGAVILAALVISILVLVLKSTNNPWATFVIVVVSVLLGWRLLISKPVSLLDRLLPERKKKDE
ncbi:MAG TPA: hypothetical protein PLP17_01870 [Oligoflexia bacterium]|nr:hypothetical protein [Oligoflexia bacterium]